ncbi:MAG: hypothetical protein CVU56_17975 [Deltaproteobacteria bacterium HGW-Deltaproteobacteria-14]|nr:MAG: hypothetical protein CVU56_17975 [Deltaproteobacteria bacterium HGW-Deltaproteobacteria-14]
MSADATTPGAANNLALLRLADGDQPGAIELLARELTAHPSLPAARLNRALLLVRAGRHADAEPDLVALIGVDPPPADAATAHERAVAHALLTASRARQGLPWEEVRAASGMSLDTAPADDVARLTRRVVGLAAFAGRHLEAAAAWLDGDPEPAASRARLASLVGLDRDEEARQVLAALPSATPYDALVAGWLAYRAEGDVAVALDRVPAADWPTDGPVARARLEIVAADAARRGAWGDTSRALRAAVQLGAPAATRLHLAVALAHAGDLDAARDEAQRVLRDAPDAPLARRLVQLLE